ncbi:hypothetical protein BDW72DRAFT_14916 [Aspergillus terricola var. indicus]
MRLYSILAMAQYPDLDRAIAFATSHLETLIERGLLREAIEILSYVCIYLRNKKAGNFDMWKYYIQITTKLDQQWKMSTENDKIKDMLLLQTSIKTVLFIGLHGQVQPPPTDLDEIARDIDEIRIVLFEMIAAKKPPESLIERLLETNCSRLRPRRAKERAGTQEHAVEIQKKDLVEVSSSIKTSRISQGSGINSLPQSDVFVQEIEDNKIFVRAPEKETYVQGPKKTVYIQFPEKETYVQGPQSAVYIKGPRKKTYVQGPQKTVYVQRAEKETYIQTPDGPVFIQNPQTDTQIMKPRGQLRIYDLPTKSIYMDIWVEFLCITHPRIS